MPGRGKCGVAVVRISGSSAFKVCQEMVGLVKPPTPRKALLKYIHDPITKNNIDKGLVLWFPGKSYCCEVCYLKPYNNLFISLQDQTVLQEKIVANFKFTVVQQLFKLYSQH